MKLAMIGLGKMGMNMARRLMQGNHEIIAYDLSQEAVEEIAAQGASGADSLQQVVEMLSAPRIVWIMLPAGKPVEDTINQLKELLSSEDIIIDGGNTYYKDDLRRFETLKTEGIHYMDVGVSGGIWGLQVGYCMMMGGAKKIFKYLEPIFQDLAPKDGYLYCGKAGAGHFVKMVHNGIEYALMQAYGEGFEILDASEFSESFDYAKIAHMWNQGSVIRSWLLELAEDAFNKSEELTDITGYVEDSGEGRWTVQQAVDTAVPAEVITLSLMRRFRSRQQDPFTDRVLSALRREFGGHAVVATKK